MTIPTKKPRDLTMQELISLVRETVHQVLEEERPPLAEHHGLLSLEPLSIGEWSGKREFIKREDFYDSSRG